jgi:exopolysaccharide production protein ExoQ
MNPLLASLICACGVGGLFYLDRDKTVRTSWALWLPTLWIGIVGSRAVSAWFSSGPKVAPIENIQVSELNGSPVDAAIFGILSVVAVGVLIRRSSRTRALLKANWPILIYFFFCLISVAWSYHPDIAFKRWTKAIGDLAMVFIITTDRQPMIALKRLISRLGFVLLPVSVLFIKYFGDLGRGYTPDGQPMNTGVTTNKNSLGLLVFVVSLCTLWQVIVLWRAKDHPNRRRHLFAQGALLAFGILLLKMADSSTSTACFIIGAVLILGTGLRSIRSRPALIHALCLMILIAGALTLTLGGQGDVAHALGRQSNFSGRTAIWEALIPAAVNPIIGAGFESFWFSPNVTIFQHTLELQGWWQPQGLNEAHDGYLEVYMNLGFVGLGLIVVLLLSGYWHAVAAFRKNPSLGSLMLAYIVASLFYNITEAGFRMMNPMWIFLLLAVVSASGVAAGLFSGMAADKSTYRGGLVGRALAGNKLLPEKKTAYAAPQGLV